MLKETASTSTPAVTELFNISIRLGELLDELKVSCVSPILKSDNHSDPASYCPISLWSILSKPLDRHTRDILLAHFEEHHSTSTQQWRFTYGKSTTGGLLDTIDQLFRTGTWHLPVFFNYSKALWCSQTNHQMACTLSLLTHSICLCKWLIFRYFTCVIKSAWNSSTHHLCRRHHKFTTVWWKHDIVSWQYNAVPFHLYTYWLWPSTTGYW